MGLVGIGQNDIPVSAEYSFDIHNTVGYAACVFLCSHHIGHNINSCYNMDSIIYSDVN